jgi:acyl-CoA synthetase (AMP-forming)/AMP-acid ligase II
MADPTSATIPQGETVPWGSDLAARAAQYGPRLAVYDGAATITYAALAARAGRLAHMLRERGAAHGEPVASALPNGIPAVWVAAAMRAAGVAEVALNAHQTEAERRHCLALSGARLVVTQAAQAAAFRDAGCAVLAVEDVPDAPAPLDAMPPVPAGAHGRISFTSGTTGKPKAIVTTHGARWIGNLLQRASFPVMPTPDSKILLMTPFVHGAGILSMAFHDRGAGVVLLNGVDVPAVLRALDEGGIDFIFAPPTVLAKLCAALEGRTVPGLSTIFTGTAPLLPALYDRARAIFGPVIRVTYGKSEINNPIAALSPAETDAYYAEADRGDGVCVGFPGTGVEIEIRDEDGTVLPPGDEAGGVGEVHLRGRHMACGHIDGDGFHPLPPDGFHATGDLGRIDPRGRLHLVGRLADVIKSGGYKVHPDEIEHALAPTAPFVSVLSLPSDYWGEVIIAVAETEDAGWPERARAALGDLARHKCPRAFLTMAELPRNAQGKVMRRLIRAHVLATHTLLDGPYPKLEAR